MALSSSRLAVYMVRYRAFYTDFPKPCSEGEIILLAGRLTFLLPRVRRGETGLPKHLRTTGELMGAYWYSSSICKKPTDFHTSVDHKAENHS